MASDDRRTVELREGYQGKAVPPPVHLKQPQVSPVAAKPQPAPPAKKPSKN